MSERRQQYLKIALVAFGLVFVVGIHPMMLLWPSGWAWTPDQAEFRVMILGLYATLGIFLILAARNPMAHRSLIWFTVWSSAVHAGIMAVQAMIDPTERGHLIGDVPALFLVAIVLALLMPRGAEATA